MISCAPDERRGVTEVAPTLRRIAGRVDLNEDPCTRIASRDFVDQRCSIETAPDIDDPDEQADLVALEPPDEVHLWAQLLDGRTLVEQFLCVVLADRLAACGHRGNHGVRPEPLRHPDDGDPVGPRTFDVADPSAQRGDAPRHDVRIDHGSSNQATSA